MTPKIVSLKSAEPVQNSEKILSIRCLCRHDCFSGCPSVTSALLCLLVGIWGMIARWIHLWLCTVFLEDSEKTTNEPFSKIPLCTNTMLQQRRCAYLGGNIGCLHVRVLRDVCALHGCVGGHELREEEEEMIRAMDSLTEHFKTPRSQITVTCELISDPMQSSLTVPALPRERWLICCARGAIMEVGCSDIDGSIEGDSTAPWRRSVHVWEECMQLVQHTPSRYLVLSTKILVKIRVAYTW